MKVFLKQHPSQVVEAGDCVWLKVVRKPRDNKLDLLWARLAEVLSRTGSDRYRIAGQHREHDIESYQLKPYLHPLTYGPPLCTILQTKSLSVTMKSFPLNGLWIIERV